MKTSCAGLPTEPPIDRQVTIHRVYCCRTHEDHTSHLSSAYFLDIQALPAGANPTTPLHGQNRLMDIGGYLAGWDGFGFVIYLDYDCEAYHEGTERAGGLRAQPTSERLQLSGSLEEALNALREQDTKYFEEWNFKEDLVYPYTRLYDCKRLFVEPVTKVLEPRQQLDLEILFRYLTDRLNLDHEELEKLSTAGLVRQNHWMMLFRPDDTVVTTRNGQVEAFAIKSCRLLNQTTLIMECWIWKYDGTFFREHFTTVSEWPSRSKQVTITDLSAYPIRFAVEGVELKLRQRGHMFWSCRDRKYVDYTVPLQGLGSQLTNLRYMIDMKMYRSIHSPEDDPPRQSELTEDVLGDDEIPEGSFALLLPATINGYGFHNKKWNVLLVEHIQDIKWNSEVFEDWLVLDGGKKELLKALVTAHSEKSREFKTDFMDGKGKGLIMLLHGGPGTGKTLTAESIAELIQRPLYRITCGDIGTDAGSVEKYLESALYIGSTWDCVVLMDEADIFLEERRKMDFQRNALASVFLRILEYYDGILILTTNRVGTFDEAFKSRVQLALHYPPLDREGRCEEISKKLDMLARHKLNGRQIRNTINTARQLARYKKEKLRYSHVDLAVRVANEFEKYVTDVHGHDDEEYARNQGLRNDVNSGEVN
ncbi:unnamed protein product [Alternaria alternata]